MAADEYECLERCVLKPHVATRVLECMCFWICNVSMHVSACACTSVCVCLNICHDRTRCHTFCGAVANWELTHFAETVGWYAVHSACTSKRETLSLIFGAVHVVVRLQSLFECFISDMLAATYIAQKPSDDILTAVSHVHGVIVVPAVL